MAEDLFISYVQPHLNKHDELYGYSAQETYIHLRDTFSIVEEGPVMGALVLHCRPVRALIRVVWPTQRVGESGILQPASPMLALGATI